MSRISAPLGIAGKRKRIRPERSILLPTLSTTSAPVSIRTTLIGFVLFFAFAAALQALKGAYAADFAGNPDEAAHYVTGVMARDYVAAFPWQPPMAFARDFYDRYPFIAIGHWPPMFYAVQAAWTLLFGVSRLSVLLLIAAIAAASATIVFALSKKRFGTAAAGALALAFLSTPIVQEYGRMVMAEMLVTLFVLLAVAAYRRYLDTGRWRESLQFALLASAAIMTKPNGLSLALVPIAAVLTARRFDLMKRLHFWLPALVVVILCGPWYVATADLAREGWSASYEPSWLIGQAAAANVLYLVRIAAMPVFVLALLGAIYELWPRRDRPANPDSAVLVALLCSIWLFHSFIVPVREPRHLIPAIPALLMLAASALAAIARKITSTAPAPKRAVLTFGTLAVVAFLFGSIEARPPSMGADAAVGELLSQTSPSDVVLVSSSGIGEGVFVAELVEQQRRPGRRVVRASKALSSSNWDGSGYRLSYDSADDADAFLRSAHINVLVIDLHSVSRVLPHHGQLLEVVRMPNRWRRLEPSADSGFGIFQAVRP